MRIFIERTITKLYVFKTILQLLKYIILVWLVSAYIIETSTYTQFNVRVHPFSSEENFSKQQKSVNPHHFKINNKENLVKNERISGFSVPCLNRVDVFVSKDLKLVTAKF